MRHEFGVTIGSNLTDQDIRDTDTFHHTCVLDMRRCINNGPRPIEETTLRRLANFRVGYEQMPMSLYSATSRQQNDLYRTITEQRGNVLVLTDEPLPMAQLCEQTNIPVSGRDIFIMETAKGDIPVQMKTPAAQATPQMVSLVG